MLMCEYIYQSFQTINQSMRQQSLFLNWDKIIKSLGDVVGISLADKVDIVKFGNG